MAYERVNWENLPSTKTPVNPDNLNKMDEGIANAVEKSDLLNLVYPVGSIYMSVNSTNPSVLFGGTWEQIKDKFLLSAGDTYNAGDEGGEATHILTIDEMPSHNHTWGWKSSAASGNSTWNSAGSDKTGSSSDIIGSTGGGKPHNNMPPYLAVFMWKRIA